MGNENLNEFSLISQALDDGLDLREYSQKINGKLTKAEEDIVQGFLDNSEKTVQLHLKVKSCDSILERVESMLEGFQVTVNLLRKCITLLTIERFLVHLHTAFWPFDRIILVIWVEKFVICKIKVHRWGSNWTTVDLFENIYHNLLMNFLSLKKWSKLGFKHFTCVIAK